MNPNPQSSQLTAVSTFSTNDNKALLWSVLHGGGKFVGIPDYQQQNVQEMFELTIREMSEHYRRLNQPINLNAVNKEAVVVICKKIDAMKQQSQLSKSNNIFNNPPQQQNYQKKQQQFPQLETVYMAEDLQKERQNAFQTEFKKKEEEMSSILKLKKPEEINFTDDVYDKPIGNDMERLLAEALASRERELEQIKSVAFAPPPPPSLSDSKNSQLHSNANENVEEFITYKTIRGENFGIKENEKRVSFKNELHVIENRHNENENENENHNFENKEYNNGNKESNDEGDVSFIFNKLKKIKTRKNEEHRHENEENYVNENNNNSHIIMKISEDIENIKITLAQLLEKVNKL